MSLKDQHASINSVKQSEILVQCVNARYAFVMQGLDIQTIALPAQKPRSNVTCSVCHSYLQHGTRFPGIKCTRAINPARVPDLPYATTSFLSMVVKCCGVNQCVWCAQCYGCFGGGVSQCMSVLVIDTSDNFFVIKGLVAYVR